MTTMTAARLRAQTAPMEQVPDPEVPERPRPPRSYPAAYKLRILEEYEQLNKQGKGALLRREGLYTSLISEWRKQRDKGALAAFTAPRGAAHRSTRFSARTPACSGRTPGCASSWSGPAR
jgi:transposase